MTNVVSTSFSGRLFNGGITFIHKIIANSDNIVDKILIWDLDMNPIEKRIIQCMIHPLYKDKIKIVNFPEETFHLYPEYFGIPKQFAWTPAVWLFSREYGDNILWMDSNKPPVASLDKVFKKIEEEHLFAGSGYGEREYIKNWAHDTCKEAMGITDEIGEKRVIHAGTLGYKKDGKYNDLFRQAYEFSKRKEVIQGRKDIHARDQVVISALIAKTDYKLYRLTSNEPVDKGECIIRTYWEGEPKESNVILQIYRFQ